MANILAVFKWAEDKKEMRSPTVSFNKAKHKNNRGIAITEFAIVMPVLLILVFGIIEFGVLLYDKALLTNASREGARVGIVYIYYPSEGITDYYNNDKKIIESIEEYLGIDTEPRLISFKENSTIEIIIDPSENHRIYSPAHGDILTVTLRYKFDFLVFSNIMNFFGNSFDNFMRIEAQTSMLLE